ncbi:MAG: hypothetical protein HZB46_01555 [Solirubrobacterales bacterium]|nr:hypothetical protein [Solirubrobacterales bacterium]
MRRRAAAALAVLCTAGLAGCGGDDDGGGQDRAAQFKQRSTALCDRAVAAARRETTRLEQQVAVVAKTGDPEALRQELLRYLDRTEAALRPLVQESRDVTPPEDAEAWQELQDRSEAAFTKTFDDASSRVRETDFTSLKAVQGLLGRLEEVSKGFSDVARQSDRVYRKYGVQACLSDRLTRALQ